MNRFKSKAREFKSRQRSLKSDLNVFKSGHQALKSNLSPARRADGPHDVVLRARADGAEPVPEAERRVLVRFLRAAGLAHEVSDLLHGGKVTVKFHAIISYL